MPEGSRIRIGVLSRTFGLDGGIGCTIDGDAVPRIALPCDAWIGYSAQFLEPVRLIRADERPNELICYFATVGDRTRAEALLDRALYVPGSTISYANALANPGIVGYEVRDEEGKTLGTIALIFRTPAHFIWQIEADGGEWLLPAIDQFVLRLIPDERVAVVRPIEGLIEGGEDIDDRER